VSEGVQTFDTRTNNFEIIPREVLQDSRISFRALGVLVDLLSRPEGWKTSATRIASSRRGPTDQKRRPGAEGRDAIETALAELERVGYLARKRIQNKETGTWSWLWMYGDNPVRVAAAMAEHLAARN